MGAAAHSQNQDGMAVARCHRRTARLPAEHRLRLACRVASVSLSSVPLIACRFSAPRMDTDGHEGMPHAKTPLAHRSVLLLFIFLFFRKDFSFINGYELPNDILCISRSDDNRRAAGAVNLSAFSF